MTTLRPLRMSFAAACAGALAGGATLLMFDGEPLFEGARPAFASAAPADAAAAAGRAADWDFILCNTGSTTGAISSGRLRLAAAQTEAP